MIAAIISAVAELLKIIGSWISYSRDKLLIALGASQQSGTDLQGRIDALQEANKAREAERDSIERDADGLMSDDGFRRTEDDA